MIKSKSCPHSGTLLSAMPANPKYNALRDRLCFSAWLKSYTFYNGIATFFPLHAHVKWKVFVWLTVLEVDLQILPNTKIRPDLSKS